MDNLETRIVRTLLKTPTSQLAVNGGSQHPERRKAGGHGPTLADEIEHLIPVKPGATTPKPSTNGKQSPDAKRPTLKPVDDYPPPLWNG